MHEVDMIVNGVNRTESIPADATLLHALRDRLDLTGPKAVCEVGTCGGCTVLIDDLPVYSCLVLAVECDRQRIDTVEGLSDGADLSALQESFASCDALQCGYCTPGQLMSLEGLRRANPTPDSEEIMASIQGNLCRCGAYRHILDAAHRVFDVEQPGCGR